MLLCCSFGIVCGLRNKAPHPPAENPYGYGDVQYGNVISGTPMQPMSIAKGYTDGYVSWSTLDRAALEEDANPVDFPPLFPAPGIGGITSKLVIVNGNQKAYQVSELTGFM